MLQLSLDPKPTRLEMLPGAKIGYQLILGLWGTFTDASGELRPRAYGTGDASMRKNWISIILGLWGAFTDASVELRPRAYRTGAASRR
jgi:hypothetical protein